MKPLYCKYLNNSVCFNENKILFCTMGNDNKNKKLPVIVNRFDGNTDTFETIVYQINKMKENMQYGVAPETCIGCSQLREIEADETENSSALKYILFSNWYKCNSKCIYCQKPVKNDEQVDPEKEEIYNIIPIIKNMIKKNMITKDTIIDFAGAGGEPTLYKYFNKAIDLLVEQDIRKLIVHTNAIKHNKCIEKAVNKGLMDVCVSVDAGTKKVHEKIKQVKTFNKVWENIARYANAKSNLSDNLIITKYIIVPGLNDSKEEIEQWVENSQKAGVSKLILNADDRIYQAKEKYYSTIMKIIELTEHFAALARKKHFRYELYWGCFLPYLYMDKMDFPSYVSNEIPQNILD